MLAIWLCLFACVATAQSEYYFPGKDSFDPDIPSPEDFLGYPVGDHHTRYDLMVDYFRLLGEISPRASFEVFGESVERRPQIILTISSEQNMQRLEEIRKSHLGLTDPELRALEYDNIPVIIQLGYNVHGNEASGGEASLLTAYWLLASRDPEIAGILDNSVIFIEPVLNPDGRSRFSSWVNMNRGNPPVADPNDREHTEAWPGGRTNHYWFDLNRDWLPLTQQESRNRVMRFHNWVPNVVTDHHEMGTNSTFFFEPTKKGSENQIISMENYRELNNLFAAEYSKALDAISHYYESGDSFDNSYPGYGSTYADVHGGLAILFEQASTRGLIQTTDLGYDLEFKLGIRNQLFGALTTVRTAVREKEKLNEYMHRFYISAVKEAISDPVKAYIFGDKNDHGRTREFIDLLNLHNIEVYKLQKESTIDGKQFIPGTAFVVPTQQSQYKMVRTIFEPVMDFRDSLFYDASAWAMVYAYGLPFAGSTRPVPVSERVKSLSIETRIPEKSTIGYVFDWSDFYSGRALSFLMDKGLKVKSSGRPFTILTDGGQIEFGRGTILLPVPYQDIGAEKIHEIVISASKAAGINVYSVKSSYSLDGPWLGSANFASLSTPSVLLLTGDGVSSSVAGEIWHMFDTKLNMPVTKADISRFGRISLSDYSVIILASGSFGSLGEREVTALGEWVSEGGSLIATGSSISWLNSKKLVDVKIDSRFRQEEENRIDYEISRQETGKHSIGGIFCSVDLDITHPLGYGYSNRSVVVYRNSTMSVSKVGSATSNVAVYTDDPLVSGFITDENLERIRNSASVIALNRGRGNIILFVDDPVFRGCWFGTAKMLMNAVFFGAII